LSGGGRQRSGGRKIKKGGCYTPNREEERLKVAVMIIDMMIGAWGRDLKLSSPEKRPLVAIS